MYAVIIKPDMNYLPTVINMNSNNFCDFMFAGYEILNQGTEKEMQSIAEEMIENFIID